MPVGYNISVLHGFTWCKIVLFIRSLTNSLWLMEWQVLLAWLTVTWTLWSRCSHSHSSCEYLFCIPTVHEQYREYFWRVKIQALDWNFRHLCIPAKWYFLGFGGGREELLPSVAIPLQQSYWQLMMWHTVYCHRNDSLQEQLLLASKRKVYLNF